MLENCREGQQTTKKLIFHEFRDWIQCKTEYNKLEYENEALHKKCLNYHWSLFQQQNIQNMKLSAELGSATGLKVECRNENQKIK